MPGLARGVVPVPQLAQGSGNDKKREEISLFSAPAVVFSPAPHQISPLLLLIKAISTFVYATSSRDRSIQWPIKDAASAAKDIHAEVNNNKEISIIFGKEDRGLTNDELENANRLIEIPANPKYPVLNLMLKILVNIRHIFLLFLILQDLLKLLLQMVQY